MDVYRKKWGVEKEETAKIRSKMFWGSRKSVIVLFFFFGFSFDCSVFGRRCKNLYCANEIVRYHFTSM